MPARYRRGGSPLRTATARGWHDPPAAEAAPETVVIGYGLNGASTVADTAVRWGPVSIATVADDLGSRDDAAAPVDLDAAHPRPDHRGYSACPTARYGCGCEHRTVPHKSRAQASHGFTPWTLVH